MARKKLEHGCLVKWRKRHANAVKRGHFTTYEASLAASWKVCAIGEAHYLNADVVKYKNSEPQDGKLAQLGVNFCNAVCNCTGYDNDKYRKKDFHKVKTLLNRIEKRLYQLYTLVEE